LHDPKREPLAVMFTDIAGFTPRMEKDEEDALACIDLQRRALSGQLVLHGGSLIKEMGDGTLSVFPSAVSAVRSARGLQDALRSADFRVRVGIHWGEVLLEDEDVFGDTVNIASRLEEIAAPGGVCVSGELLGRCAGRKPGVKPLGLCKLKGLGRLVEAYDLTGTRSRPLPVTGGTAVEGVEAMNDIVPSVAVMLLENLGDQADSFYAYGITADLVTDLARAGRISVAPLSDALRAMDTTGSAIEAGRRLSVAYVVKGALAKTGSVFHLSVVAESVKKNQLVWADNWDDDWFDLPALKGKLADGILKALGRQPSSYPGITSSPTAAAEAYDLYLQGRHIFRRKRTEADLEKARLRFEQALALDPGLVMARVMLGTTWREVGDLERSRLIFEDAAQIASDKGDLAGKLMAMNANGISQWMSSNLKQAQATFRQVLRLARSLGDRDGEARALNNLGLMGNSTGDFRGALHYLQQSLQISREIDAAPLQARTLCNIGLSSNALGEVEQALEYYQKSYEILVSIEDFDGQSDVLRLMGIARFRHGDLEDSLDLAKKSLKLSRDLGDRPGQCKSLNNVGTAVFRLGLKEEAAGYFDEALDMASGIGDRVVESLALSNLGRIRLEEEREAEACALFEKALEISREVGDTEGEGDAMSLLGQVLSMMGRPEAAIGYLDAALDILERTGDEASRAEASALLAGVLVDSSPTPANIQRSMLLIDQAERSISPMVYDAPSRHLMIAQACRRLSLLFLESDDRRRQLEARYRMHVRQAQEGLEESAARLTDPALRKSFLERIGAHRAILAAWRGIGS